MKHKRNRIMVQDYTLQKIMENEAAETHTSELKLK